jgi:ElaB/YqjD/DUF883 family membrane-anchored ribosome-binding protein
MPYGSQGDRPGEETGGAFGRPSVEEEYREGAERAEDVGERGREMASEHAGKAQEQMEAGKERAATGMERAAERVRERAGSQGGMAGQAGEKVAEGMERSATYLREHSTEEIRGDVERYVREHPMQAMAGALVAGFVLSRILR